jgi:hypothetical protein
VKRRRKDEKMDNLLLQQGVLMEQQHLARKEE